MVGSLSISTSFVNDYVYGLAGTSPETETLSECGSHVSFPVFSLCFFFFTRCSLWSLHKALTEPLGTLSLDVWRFVHELGYSNESSSKTKGELYSVVCSPIDAALVATAGGDDRGFLWKIGQADWAFELQGNGFLRGFLHLGITYHSILKANMKKVKHLVEPPDSKTKLSLWKADLAQEGSFDEAIKGCTGVFHVATPMDFDSKDTEGKIKQTMDKAFWDGIMENEAGEKRPCITFFQRHGWSIMKFIPYGTVYVGICVV
ncbi:hypothetical protein GLYMA_17G173200v4 [Glycine max]|uniref:3-beta hydroxysteroid dehydrogenase/isomerase domain-containing protein n=2 Tax=Glycine subgen. Soja TaxID=1462606 RepID=A0A0R0FE46_SOYBN|nr:uncharacterized protein LOC100812851 isoform X3 [Glycine max]XP_014625257.1 uncharacterized protein LOC100812851 isoform X3 [Glycine max]XP_014625258.1 uncharacterized protein LOC100812851 isoform X3 [Glycine max]XP_014625260.1 uncharacterized protein LOC100812851 isoform X3 [Glycine max]XP_040866982.1 uncharacterized protein LOC100812851 isoform X3 [Glycine max]XP_040866983.1 uncharacterized protein LOC100812851 isoform X3 [Glycine max]RZB57316.1 Dihydroflavonol 4-reductase [Glycine soja]|eukprot:XP_006600972.1 uncharacterized protein LOC100812851 isoform X2 [Glycine max]